MQRLLFFLWLVWWSLGFLQISFKILFFLVSSCTCLFNLLLSNKASSNSFCVLCNSICSSSIFSLNIFVISESPNWSTLREIFWSRSAGLSNELLRFASSQDTDRINLFCGLRTVTFCSGEKVDFGFVVIGTLDMLGVSVMTSSLELAGDTTYCGHGESIVEQSILSCSTLSAACSVWSSQWQTFSMCESSIWDAGDSFKMVIGKSCAWEVVLVVSVDWGGATIILLSV